MMVPSTAQFFANSDDALSNTVLKSMALGGTSISEAKKVRWLHMHCTRVPVVFGPTYLLKEKTCVELMPVSESILLSESHVKSII